eukprot:scaffold68310_cov68-Phaeocystis_antarctica.AAC.3
MLPGVVDRIHLSEFYDAIRRNVGSALGCRAHAHVPVPCLNARGLEAKAEAEEAAISRADGAPSRGAATKLHAAKMSAARMNAARLLNGQSNDAGLRGDAVNADDGALPTDYHLFGF